MIGAKRPARAGLNWLCGVLLAGGLCAPLAGCGTGEPAKPPDRSILDRAHDIANDETMSAEAKVMAMQRLEQAEVQKALGGHGP